MRSREAKRSFAVEGDRWEVESGKAIVKVKVKVNGGGLIVYVYGYVYESLVAGVWWRVTRNFESGRRKAESRREAQKSNQPEAIFAWARGDCAGAQAPKPQSPEG